MESLKQMKNKLIKFIKKHPYLYNLAKKVNRRLNRISPKQEYQSKYIYYTYMLEDEKELEKIKKHYQEVKTDISKLFIINTNPKYQPIMHQWIRDNQNILFADLNYFKKYKKKMLLDKAILLDYKTQNQKELLSYIQWK